MHMHRLFENVYDSSSTHDYMRHIGHDLSTNYFSITISDIIFYSIICISSFQSISQKLPVIRRLSPTLHDISIRALCTVLHGVQMYLQMLKINLNLTAIPRSIFTITSRKRKFNIEMYRKSWFLMLISNIFFIEPMHRMRHGPHWPARLGIVGIGMSLDWSLELLCKADRQAKFISFVIHSLTKSVRTKGVSGSLD